MCIKGHIAANTVGVFSPGWKKKKIEKWSRGRMHFTHSSALFHFLFLCSRSTSSFMLYLLSSAFFIYPSFSLSLSFFSPSCTSTPFFPLFLLLPDFSHLLLAPLSLWRTSSFFLPPFLLPTWCFVSLFPYLLLPLLFISFPVLPSPTRHLSCLFILFLLILHFTPD